MKFKTDENLPIDTVEVLRKLGFDCASVFEQSLQGNTDSRIITVCNQEDRILITLDTDFSDIRQYPPKDCPGIIVLRLQHQDKPSILRAINLLAPLLGKETLSHHLWIVEDNRIRIRS